MKILFISIFIVFIVKFTMTNTTYSSNSLEYIITETGLFDSLDPLDADKTQNLPVARMIYATPIEIDKNGNLSSNVLSEFSYNEETKQIHFSLKKAGIPGFLWEAERSWLKIA